ncbi:MAG: tetratricopeptide repeat protein [Flavobacterium sp.]|nr:tetratricopeptide repeat protein [Flavobacterium sp.]
MYKNILVIVGILIFSSCEKIEIKKTNQKADSIKLYLKNANDIKTPFEIRKRNNEKALNIVSKQSNDTLNRFYYFKIANRYYNIGELEKFKKISLKLIRNSVSANDSVHLAKSYTFIADYYSYKFVSDSAYLYYYKSGKIYSLLKDNIKTAETILNKAVCQLNEKDYVGSEKSIFKALKLLNIKNKKLNYQSYNLLGIIYNELSEFDKSIEYHNKALELLKSENSEENRRLSLISLNNIGLIYQNKKDYKQSILYFQKALEEKQQLKGDLFLKAALNLNLGYSQFKLNNLSELPRLFDKQLKSFQQLNSISGIINCKLNLTEYYTFKKDKEKAFSFANSSYQLAKTKNLPKDILLSLKQLSIVNPKKIADYSSEYIKISDSLQLAERKMRNKLARIEFETEELTVEKKDLVIKQRNIIFIAFGIVFLLSIAFLIRFQIMKNRTLLLKQEQQKANEEVYQLLLNQQNKIESVRQLEKKRIAQELHDGILGKLFGTRMNLGILNNEKDDNQVKKRMFYIEELKGIEQEIREISHDLSSEKTAVFNNFVAMVSQFIENQKSVCSAEIKFELDDNINWNQQENMLKINFYRILQECFQNINKHANATQVFVTFEKSETNIILNIQDNGIGFNYFKKKKGIGLRNMIARTEDSKGTMSVDTNPGKGTTLNFEMPQL